MSIKIIRIGYGPSTLAGGGGTGLAERYIDSFNNTSDWALSGDDYTITVLSTAHGKGVNPTVHVYMDNTVTFEEVVVPVTISSVGDVKIYVTVSPNNRFTGKLVII